MGRCVAKTNAASRPQFDNPSPLRNLVSPFLLISKNERFCPQCYEADLNAERPMYNRLLWSIACVEACPLHRMLLQEIPTAPPAETLPFGCLAYPELTGPASRPFAQRLPTTKKSCALVWLPNYLMTSIIREFLSRAIQPSHSCAIQRRSCSTGKQLISRNT